MKRIVFLILVVLGAIDASAEVRTMDEMQQIAKTVLTRSTLPRLRAKAQNTPLQLLMEKEQLSVLGYADGGWVIVSKDDNFDAVLGYSDGLSDKENHSPEFLWLLERFDKGMAADLSKGTRRMAPARRASTVLREVKPLLKTNWAQSWPYNGKCPTVNGKMCVTGCVATAFAQVLYYHHLPLNAYGKKTYTWNYNDKDSGISISEPLSYDFDATPIDWENITPTYDNIKSSQKEIDAVANLMYACGVLAEMSYGPSGSGAQLNTCVTQLNRYNDEVRSTDYTNYSAQENAKINIEVVARELTSARPVIFAGVDGEGGHCFVIDGADAAGLLHCNLGWGGYDNGYYSADAMNGYTQYQQIATVVPGKYGKIYLPMAELASKRITVDTNNPVTELQANTWYMMWNVGRGVSLADLGKEYYVSASSRIPNKVLSPYAAGQIVRLVPNTAGTRYKLQVGTGNYLPSFGNKSIAKSLTSTTATYTITPITDEGGETHPDCFCLLNGSNVRMDTDGEYIMGWGTGATNDPKGNASWKFYPVSMEDVAGYTQVSEIMLATDTIRMMQGDKRPLLAEVLPADAAIPDLRVVSKTATAVEVQDGQALGISRGSSIVTLSAVDGSGISANCQVYVGTATQSQTLTSLTATKTFFLRNTGMTNGYLIATDTTTTYPQLRGITKAQAGAAVSDNLYWDEAVMGDAYTQWQILKSADGDYYLYNVGMQKFLVPNMERSCYQFSAAPQPVTITLITSSDAENSNFAGCFYIGANDEETTRMMASTAYLNPAHMLSSPSVSRKKHTIWEISSLAGLSTRLPLLTAARLEAMLAPEGIASSVLQNTTPATGKSYDLQGRLILGNIDAKGLIIQNGKKRIR